MRRHPGGLEEAIINVLASRTAMTVAEVRAALGGELAHTTVMTALVRLTGKGLATRERRGRSYRYLLAASADELPALRAAIRMRHELDSRYERADVLANFVAGLSPEDEAVLLELLAKADDDRKQQP